MIGEEIRRDVRRDIRAHWEDDEADRDGMPDVIEGGFERREVRCGMVREGKRRVKDWIECCDASGCGGFVGVNSGFGGSTLVDIPERHVVEDPGAEDELGERKMHSRLTPWGREW
jgi:hypothetical protein